jgi:hypothetical protein
MPNYFVLTKHGKRGIIMEHDDEEDDDNIPNSTQECSFADDPMVEDDGSMGETKGAAFVVDPVDDLGEVLRDAKEHCEKVHKTRS